LGRTSNGFWKSARFGARGHQQAVDVEQAIAAPRRLRSMPSRTIARLINSAMPVATDPAPRNKKR